MARKGSKRGTDPGWHAPVAITNDGEVTAATPGSSATILCDLDGVVWLSQHAIAGAPEAIARLRDDHHQVLFVTNNSFPPIAEVEGALERIGIPATGDVLSSSMAAARLLHPGERALVCGGPGIVEALGHRGVEVVTDGDADAVLVGFDRAFDYERLRRAATAVRRGARLIGTNDDATYPTPEGPIPGGGSLLAAVVTASGVTPIVAGKPHAAMASLVRERLGSEPIAQVVMVGDRPDTDGAFAAKLGCRFALVWTGVTARGAVVSPTPDLVADDLAALVAELS
jgi:4-nitrophenyl phosphatase